MNAATLSAILVAIIGGGGIVPFAWRWWNRRHPRPLESEKMRVEIEAVSAHAANETINAMRGVMTVLNRQLTDRDEENASLRIKLHDSETRVDELVRQVRALGGTVT